MLDPIVLRQRLLNQRRTLSKPVIDTHSAAVCTYLAELPEFKNAKIIGCYWPVAGEIDTHPIISRCWELRKQCYLPRIKPKFQMEFIRYEKDMPIKLNNILIAEPINNEIVLPEQLELVLVPLVAFDASGHRLGFGSGYYDRCFAFLQNLTSRKTLLIGLSHSFQEVTEIIPHVWDVPLDKVITEKGIFNCR